MSGLDYRSGLISDYFSQYGYTPDPGVIAALTTSIGADDQEGVIAGEVGEFMNAVNQINKAAANDPLQATLAQENAAITSDGSAADTYATELQSVYSSAPKLFGSLTPDQIDSYLAPAQSAFNSAEQSVQGAAAKAGNTGSSLEASAMAQTDQQFKQGVTQTGLNVGMTEQTNQANVIQQLYNQKLQQQNLLYGLQQQTSGAISAQNYQNAQFMAQLPMLLNSYATQQMQLRQQQDNAGGGWESAVGTGLGGIAGGVAGFYAGGPMGAVAGASAGASLGGSVANDITGRNQPTQTSASLMQLPLLYGATKGMLGGTTGSTGAGTMSPYDTSSMSQVNPSLAGSTIMGAGSPLSLNYNMGNQNPANYADTGLNWATQPG